jgi:hypothetical protein
MNLCVPCCGLLDGKDYTGFASRFQADVGVEIVERVGPKGET